MKRHMILIMSTCIVFSASVANARIGREVQAEHEARAFPAGMCYDKKHLSFIEKIYNECGATDDQWDSLYKRFQDGQDSGQNCSDSLIDSLRGIEFAMSAIGVECQ
jgi:hypothetical protein